MAEILHGRLSATEGPERLRELWANRPDSDGLGEWVPWESILIDESINPRERGATDKDTVERYSQIVDKTPPVVVQRDTFLLVGGRHRVEGAALHGSYVRIREIDAEGDELFEQAYLDNADHGLPLTTKERVAAAKRIWKAKVARGEQVNQSDFARTYGIARRTVLNFSESGTATKSAQNAQLEPRSEPKAPRQPGTAKAPTEAKPLSETVLDPLSREMARGLEAAEQQEAALPKPEPFYSPQTQREVLLQGRAQREMTEQERIDREMAEAVARARTPEPEPVRNSWDQIERVLAGIEEMAGMWDETSPREFLTEAEPYKAMQQMDVTHFERAAAWLSATARALRTGRDE